MNKLSKLILGTSLFLMPFLGQKEAKAQNNENLENQEWNYWFGINSALPHDETLKDIFGSYIGLKAEAQKKVGENFYIAPNFAYLFKNKKITDGKINASTLELSALGLYRIDNFEIGLGPIISKLNLALKEKVNRGGITSTETENYSQSGTGYTLRLKYTFPISDKTSLFLIGNYSDIKSSTQSEFENLGTTQLGFGLEF